MRNVRLAVAGVVLLFAGGCALDGSDAEAVPAERAMETAAPRALLAQSVPRVLRCGPSPVVRRDSAVARPNASTMLQIPVQGGPPFRLRIPPGAISEPGRQFFLEVTISDTVMVRAWAEGFENGRYGFVPGTPAELWISGHRCTDQAVDTLRDETIFLLRPNGRLDDMVGQPDGSGGGNPRKWMRADLDSLSVYVIGTN